MSVTPSSIVTPTESYTRLTYIEATGEQYINTGYVVQEDDVIDMYYICPTVSTAHKSLFGVRDGDLGTWVTIYSTGSRVRYGSIGPTSLTAGQQRYHISVQKGSVDVDGATGAVEYSQMPSYPLYIFATNNNDEDVEMMGIGRTWGFNISKTSGEIVIDFKPCRRDSDGKVGMLDLVSGQFFASEGAEDFIAGAELNIGNDYEPINYVTFNADKLFDAGIIKSTYKIEVLFQRTEITAKPYLYGCITNPHTASVTAYMSSGGAWRFGTSYKGVNTNTLKMFKVEISNGTIVYDSTSGTFTKATFTTPDTLVVGGARAVSGSTSKSYKGYIYYFRVLNGSTPILDWYPCKRKSDGVEGFWDCVTQSFVSPIATSEASEWSLRREADMHDVVDDVVEEEM